MFHEPHLHAHPFDLYVPYGIAFLLLGVVLAAAPRDQTLPGALAGRQLIAAFAIIHGLLELWVGWRLIHEQHAGWAMWLTALVLTASFVPLLEVVRRRLVRRARVFSALLVWPLVAAICAVTTAVAANPPAALENAARLFIGLPGAVGTGLALFTLARREVHDVAPVVARSLRTAAAAFIVYGLLTGLVMDRPLGPLPTAHDFVHAVGVPVQFLRAVVAVVLAVCFTIVLGSLRAAAEARRLEALEFARTSAQRLEEQVAARTAELSESEGHLQRAQTVAKVGSWYEDLTTGIQSYSDEVCRMLGLEPGDVTTVEQFMPMVHRDDVDGLNAAWRAALGSGAFDHEFRVRVRGEEKWLRARADFRRDADGRAVDALGIAHDITDLKRVTLALAAREETYRLLVENQTDLVVKLDAGGHFQFASPSFCTLFGKGEEELLGEAFSPLQAADTGDGGVQAMKALHRPPHECAFEDHAETPSGRRWLAWSCKAVLDGEGRVTAVVGVGRDITERKEAELQVQRSEGLLRAVVDASPDWITVKDREHRFVLANRAAAGSRGVSPGDMLGRTDTEFWTREQCLGDPERGVPGFRQDDERALAGEVVHHASEPQQLPDGSEVVFDTLKTPLRDADGEIYAALIFRRDVTQRHRDAERLADSVDRLRLAERRQRDLTAIAQTAQGRMSALLSAMSIGILFEDGEGCVEYVNPSFVKMWGIQEGTDLVGKPTVTVLERSTHRFARASHASRHVLHVTDAHEISERFEIELLDGRTLTQVSYPVEDAEDRALGRLWVYEDITHERQTAQQLIYLAERDALTGLYNRHRFQERLDTMVKGALRSGGHFALFYFDLDEFKQINDSFGHRAGDTVLVRVAGELLTMLRSTEMFSRLGGDEFAVLCEVDGPAEVAALASRIVGTVAAIPFRFRGTSMRVTASVGVALFPEHGSGTEDLVVHADMAMYAAKARGRNTWVLYDPEADEPASSERTTWSRRLEAALAADAVVVHYQGVYRSGSREISHFEALARMREENNPDRLILPGQFIPFAERTGQVVALDRQVLRTVIRELAARPAMSPVAVNVSGRSFDDPMLPQFIRGLLEEHGVAPERLLIELTETAAVSDIQDAQRFIEAIQKLGCRVCLDDFGSGFASFAYLKYVDVDILKIDGLFIRDLPANRVNQVFVRAMVDVAKGLGMQTVAEGVETEETFLMAQSLGVDMAQGYHLDQPRPDHPALLRDS